MGKSKIEWTEVTWNPITGCTKISQGCKNCYAETIANRFWGERKFTDLQIHKERLVQPFQWKQPKMVFVNSMSDLFHERIEFEQVAKIIDVIRWTKQHTYMVLTKRPERMHEFFTKYVPSKYFVQGKDFENLDNLWLGVSVENQKAADERIPWLLRTPAKIRFISAEPLLEEIEIRKYVRKTVCDNAIVNWVIAGCESGAGRRECKPEWIEKIVKDCTAAEVPVFVKQIQQENKVVKDIKMFPGGLRVREYPQIPQINTKGETDAGT